MSSSMRRRGLVPAAAAAVIVLGVGGLAVFTNSDGHDATAASTLPAPDDVADAPTTSVPATTVAPTSPTTTEPEPAPTTAAKKKAKKKKPQPTTTPAPTTSAPTTTAAPLEPIAPPSDTRGWEESAHLGGISIPKLGVDVPLYEGIRLTTLDKGPGHWPGTAMPGHDGNAVVAAHRTSHGAPFRYIDTLVPGDEVFFDTEIGQTRYLVTATEIVPPSALWIVDQTEDATATLFACHPPGSVAERIVVHLELAVD